MPQLILRAQSLAVINPVGVFGPALGADLHLRAMTDSAAAGQRFLAAAGQLISTANATEMLGWQLRSAQDVIVATGESRTALRLRPPPPASQDRK